ncbi:unnamed protein product [Gadus morhua 'NCC']
MLEWMELWLGNEEGRDWGKKTTGAFWLLRSKRKVLGRRESDEEKSRGGSGSTSQSPPPTPTAQPPTPCSLSPASSPSACPSSPASTLGRPSGSIQRNIRKSATSSDTFKALLLKKGSRSETSFRMSAAEMLRSTDPRFQRTRADSVFDPPLPSPTSPHSPAGSPRRERGWRPGQEGGAGRMEHAALLVAVVVAVLALVLAAGRVEVRALTDAAVGRQQQVQRPAAPQQPHDGDLRARGRVGGGRGRGGAPRGLPAAGPRGAQAAPAPSLLQRHFICPPPQQQLGGDAATSPTWGG